MASQDSTDPLEGGSGGFILMEAEVSGQESSDECESNICTQEEYMDFIDNASIASDDGGRHLNALLAEDDARAVQAVMSKIGHSREPKVHRMYSSGGKENKPPTGSSHRKRTARDRSPDSGHGVEESSNGTLGTTSQVSKSWGGTGGLLHNGIETIEETSNAVECIDDLIRSGKARAAMLGIFKDSFGVRFTDITRHFKSDKTVCRDWVFLAVGVACSVSDAVPELVRPHTVYSHTTVITCKLGNMALGLVRWKTAKCRDTCCKLLSTILTVENKQLLLEPPQTQNAGAALFWYKKSISRGSTVTGETLEWIARQVSLSSHFGDAQPFCLSRMVQWAYDCGYTNESTIAYEYAKLADDDSNAEAFLKCNNQARYVRDCCKMVTLYARAEMAKMSMNEWIGRRITEVEGGDEKEWRVIVQFLKVQKVEFIPFLMQFRKFLKGTPKNNCLCFYGPSNTGKSMFCMSLLEFLKGRTISYVNSKSQFWLQPLGDSKIGLLDDATLPVWDYMDVYLRNLLDGNVFCLDAKHKAPSQIKAPPLLVTSNYNIKEYPKYSYLVNRVHVITFPTVCQTDYKGDVSVKLESHHWKSFFRRWWPLLDSAENDGGDRCDGEPDQPFRCAPRDTNGNI
ncbi:E1 [Tursiops truncatus papillomavirus 2]|uniref:Replication protein E1 n=1 Tax=Tursiops truncatus papillomavirus 2 TaxID=936060 RepID=Q1XA74_9PAPI|nr:E1 [Tursiops truncatus papillomavirus 2]AAY32854.1 E1 [Tursiops truncatus papillomavirus 2]